MTIAADGAGQQALGTDVLQSMTEQQQAYLVAYSITVGSIKAGDPLRGIAFWRWDAIDPGAQLTGFISQVTISKAH